MFRSGTMTAGDRGVLLVPGAARRGGHDTEFQVQISLLYFSGRD